MDRLISWFARNGVAANLTMVLIVVGGILALTSIKQEVFPEFAADVITVTVPYPGAAPSEVEEAICIRTEEQIQAIEGIKRITSNSSEGVGVVIVELLTSADNRRVLDEVKARVDAIDTFPVDAESPVITEVINRRQVINVAVSGEADERTLKRLGERVRDEISNLPGISQVELGSTRPYEISIEVSEAALRRHGLTFEEVALAVRQSSLDLPGGTLRTKGGEILLRTKGQAYRGEEFEKLVLLRRSDGTQVFLGEVAQVRDGFAETDQFSRFDGRPAVIVQIFRVGEQSALEVSDRVREYIETARHRMPEGVYLTTWQDDSEVLRSRLDLLLRNGQAGLFLVILVLALFLRLRVAFWISLGIPISFLGTFWLMPSLDVSINLISLFAFIVVLGIVVDNAIVVGESIYSNLQSGMKPIEAAIDGARQMAVPVIFGVATTVAAFFPLLMVTGNIGKIFGVIPLIVIPTLVFSLIEALLVLPTHMSGVRLPKVEEPRGLACLWRRFQSAFGDGLEWCVGRIYQPLLGQALEWRYLTVGLGLCALMVTAGLVAGERIRFSFFPSVEGDNVVAQLTMPQGTPVEVTAEAVRRIEISAEKLRREYEKSMAVEDGGLIQHTLTSLGAQPLRTDQSRFAGAVGQDFSGSHLGEVNLQLAQAEERTISSAELANRWRELTGPIAGAVELNFTASLFSAGEPINIQLNGPRIDDLIRAAEELKERLSQYPGVLDISDSFRAGKQELRFRLRPSAQTFELRLADLARQVRQGFFGEEVQRIQRGRDEVKVVVRLPAERRRSMADLEDLRIRTPQGGEVPFPLLAEAELERGYETIRRVDRRRSINVTADIDPAVTNANQVLVDLQADAIPDLLARYPALDYALEGEQREQEETLSGLTRGFLLALVLIYALLAIPLRSYFQPVLIMLAIPFGLVGAVWGHFLLGMDLTILSMFGMVAMAGVAVNGSLVLVHFINQRRGSGAELLEAVRQAGAARFRPILLTTLTTFAGLTPLLLERSLQAQFLIPMAVSLAYGVVFSTFVSLLMVPAGYMILNDVLRLMGLEEKESGTAR